MSTLKTTNIQNASSATTNIALDTSGGVTVGAGITASNGTVVMSSPYTMRNKIINGAMVIDQRNAGASINAADNSYCLDRWYMQNYPAANGVKYTVQQNAGSVTPPAGFPNYIGITSNSAYTLAADSIYNIAQFIEGFNVSDLGWGSANAKTITLSFWVRSSLTGTFGGCLSNSAYNRSYPFTYTISAANTWEQKTITVAGDTSGTWLTTNGIGIRVLFSLGTGTTYSGTANAWAGSDYRSPTGATSVVGTNGATFYITGVQLERGTAATPFEYRNYQQELAMCQRYFQKSYDIETAVGTASYNGYLNWNWQNLSNYGTANIILPVRMRAAPTCTNYNPALTSTVGGRYWNGSAEVAFTGSMAGWDQYQSTIRFNKDATNSTNILIQWTASAEL